MSTTELVKRDESMPVRREVLLSPVMNLQTANSRMEIFQQFVAGYLQESKDGGQDGGDYGVIPGAGKKKVLLKSGADKLCELYGIYDEYELESHENFETNLFFYRAKCILRSRADDSIVGTGLGSCSTWESKYRYRESQRKCPECHATAIIKGKDFNNTGLPTGWLCFAKKNGCGKKFKDGDMEIEGQTLGRIENPDILDTVNTVLKMAKKRAKVDAVIGVTRSSGIFTQDLDEIASEIKGQTVAVTTEDIPLKKAEPVSAGSIKGTAGTEATPRPPATPAEDFIEQGMQANFAKSFREALPKSQQAQSEVLRHTWLGQNGYFDDAGNPSSTRIPKAKFAEVREAACEWAATR